MKTTLLSFLLLVALSMNAQEHINDVQLAIDAMEMRYPGYKRAVDKTFEKTLALSQAKGDGSIETLTIPVVFHIVWKEEVENLSDELVASQMLILNEVYSRTNADTVNLRPIFEPIAGNPHIQFELAEVVRVESDVDFEVQLLSGELVDAVKLTDSGGDDAWDPALYLNIWVVNVQGDGIVIPDDALLGYAYPPVDLDNWPPDTSAPAPGLEGIVIHYKAFGADNPNDLINPFTNQLMDLTGKTCVHEVGHFLGLRHTTGDPGFGEEGCSVDDGMADTPVQGAASSFNCDLDANTCDEDGFDFPDMIENYMDYSAESCQNTFTQNQSDFMYTVLETSWPGLIVTAVNDREKIKVSIAPNPTTGILNYVIPSEYGAVSQVKLFDQIGQLIKTVKQPNGVLDFSDISAGFYIASFEIDGNVSTQRIVIQ